ncbi:hypothetical protein P3T76_001978 [Phytophthora citrophthora]|uniref:Protein C10 n=1 Tax=Phytophthora citrophthora TaxID=4793 RepID=A0AAD9GXN7_9STRA|nr:hypothetical protein P3T76_001978 [Phytophthora citrophthora]
MPRRRAPKCRPAPLQPREHLQGVDSFCVSCGSRNVTVFRQSNGCSSNQKLLKCQSCSLISPDFSQSKPQSGIQEEFVALDKAQTKEMADQILDAFTHQRTKQKLQQTLNYAQGDLGLICHKYLPVAIEVFAHVVSLFGFTDSIEGVLESVRVMQMHAKDDEQLVQKLISIRKVLTPTGNWIQEDNDAEKEDELRRELDQQALQQKKEEEQRKELLALENAKKARLRAKKISLGLDPSIQRPPVLVDVPPPVVAAREHARLELRVNAKYVQKFQWFFNGRLIEDEEFVSGINRPTLVISKLTKRTTGEFYCTCENEEGTVSSPVCRVSLAALTLSCHGSKTLKSLSTSPWYPCEKSALVCVDQKLNLYDGKSLVLMKAFPAIPAAMRALAWDSQTKTAVAFSNSIQHESNEPVQAYFYLPELGISQTTNRRRSSSNLGLPPSKTGNSLKFQLMDVQSVGEVAEVRFAAFLDTGKRLLVTDMMHQVALFDVSPYVCRKVISFDSDVVCDVAVFPRSPLVFALAFRDKLFIKIYSNKKPSSMEFSEHQINFKFPVHRAAFDASGFFLAVAETGFMKSWLSITSVKAKTPLKKRFVAHAGRISGLQWTTKSSFLLSASYDGYAKLWDPQTMSNLLTVHLDPCGIHSMLLMEELSILMVLGYSSCRLQSRVVNQLPELEASRLVELNEQAANIQKIWKGRKTRELIAKYIKEK